MTFAYMIVSGRKTCYNFVKLCITVQLQQSLSCLNTQCLEVEKCLEQNLEYVTSTQISLRLLIICISFLSMILCRGYMALITRNPDLYDNAERNRSTCIYMQSDQHLCCKSTARHAILTCHMHIFNVLASLCS